MYAATSKSSDIGETLGRNSGEYMWRLTIPKGCMQNCSIAALSSYENEDEVLLVPYTAIRVARITRVLASPKPFTRIHAEVLVDSKSEDDGLETILV